MNCEAAQLVLSARMDGERVGARHAETADAHAETCARCRAFAGGPRGSAAPCGSVPPSRCPTWWSRSWSRWRGSGPDRPPPRATDGRMRSRRRATAAR